MAAPYLTPNQVFNITQGVYFTYPVSYSGVVNVWSAVGLPEGLDIDPDTGIVSGTPIGTTNRYGYITATNDDGKVATIIKFIITIPQTQTFEFNIAPTKGYADITEYQFTTNAAAALSAYSLLWNFGDGSISNILNPTHIYDLPGSYIVSLNAYTKTGVISLSSKIDVKLLINESIYFDHVPPPTFAGHYNRYPFTINFTSSFEGPHYIDLAAQFSRSYESQNPQNKWSFLRPEWRFLDLSGNRITTITTNNTLIYADELGKINHDRNGFVVGVTGTASFYFVDDIYNFDLSIDNKPYTTLIATLRTSGVRSYNDSFNADRNLPGYANSLATTTCPYIFFLRPPDKLNITENGIRNYINPRWPSSVQPLIVDTTITQPYPDPWIDGNGVKLYEYPGAFCHYLPIEGQNPITVNLGSPDIEVDIEPKTPLFKWIDDTGYKTPGYFKGSFTTNAISALNASLTGNLSYNVPPLTGQFFNPILWLSNPEAGMMSTAQYIYSNALSAVTTPNLKIAQVHNFGMPVITQPDFANNPMALSGFHGINSIAALPLPTYHAWVLDSELNYMYRINTLGIILCAVDINKIVRDNNLGFYTTNQVSPASIVLDSKQNIWMTLYDTQSALKFDNLGNFLFATTPLSATGYTFPPNIDPAWYDQNTYYSFNSAAGDYQNDLNAIDLNFLEPTGIDTDSKDNVWITYSNYASGYLSKFDSNGGLLFTYSYPVCSCPQEIVVDNKDNIWIACSNNIWQTRESTLEKRDSFGNLLSSISPIYGLNHLTLDLNQNPWFTFSYSWIGAITGANCQLFTANLSGSGKTAYHSDWFDPAINTDETALEGIAVDFKGLVYVINSIENQVYVFDPKNNFVLNSFYINPQGFVFYQADQYQPTLIESSLWGKSLQATGDWTGLRWCNKYGKTLPYYQTSTTTISITGKSVPLNFIQHEEYDIFKKNEDFDMAAQMKSLAFMPSLNDSKYLFDNFFGSIFGKSPFKHTDLGVQTYEKIANYVGNHSDIDSCNINQLYDLAASVDLDSEDFRLNYPESIERIIDIASINQSRLMGARSLEQNAFTKVNSQDEINRGELITSLCYIVTAGVPLILKDRSLNKYRVVPTGNLYGLSAYPLQSLANSIGLVDNNWPSYYEFYEFIPSYDFSQLEGYIDWNNPQTTLSETLSTNNQWFSHEGFLDSQLSYELYKGLGFL
jgi:hypothetical protein